LKLHEAKAMAKYLHRQLLKVHTLATFKGTYSGYF